MREVDESLEFMKKDYKKRMDECEQRRIQFEQKQAKMREQVLKFEKFIQENDAKRVRAEAKIKHERKLYEEKCKELSSLNESIVELDINQTDLLSALAKKQCYKAYLERIVEENDQGYEEMSDILNRHKTLLDANIDLMKHAQDQESNVDNIRLRLQSFKTEKQNQLLVNNSFFQQNQKELERMRGLVKKVEEDKCHDEDKKKNISRESSQLTSAIENIFQRCQASMRQKVIIGSGKEQLTIPELLDAELDIIHARVVDLLEISQEFILESDVSLNGGLNNELKDASNSTTISKLDSKSQLH